MRKYWKRLTTRKLQKSKYRKILKTKIPEYWQIKPELRDFYVCPVRECVEAQFFCLALKTARIYFP